MKDWVESETQGWFCIRLIFVIYKTLIACRKDDAYKWGLFINPNSGWQQAEKDPAFLCISGKTIIPVWLAAPR